MAPRRAGLKVRGLKETARAFDHISDDLSGELTDGLKKAAEPVRTAAQDNAVRRIRNVTRVSGWAEQKIGVSKRSALVYMVPVKRRTRSAARRRPNFAELMLKRAMEPALDANEHRVREEVDDVLNRLGRRNGF